MYITGKRIKKLSEMVVGNLYMFVESEEVNNSDLLSEEMQKMKDENGNVLYTFILLKKEERSKDVVYHCDLIEMDEQQSNFKLFEDVDQKVLDNGTCALYSLGEA